MSATANADSPIAKLPAYGGFSSDQRRRLASVCPQAVLNWREARYYKRHGDIELHLLDLLCRRDQDAIDVGARAGEYVHFLRRRARRVIAFESTPALMRVLRRKFGHELVIESMALSDAAGMVSLDMPVVDGAAAHRVDLTIDVPADRLDNVYKGDVGFIKIDIQGQQAALDGAVATIERCRPRLLVRLEERLSPGSLARAKAYFVPLAYRGYYVDGARLRPIDGFTIDAPQNFIFLPPAEPAQTVKRLADRLSRL
jgi:FkbM family methyltransferase